MLRVSPPVSNPPRPSQRRLRATALALLLLAALSAPAPAGATPRFVALTGNDANAGTIDAPWRYVGPSIARLLPGDTLYVRGGRFYEWNLSVSVSGAPGAPIVVRSYPGETAIIDPTKQSYRTPGNDDWVLADSARNEWVSRGSVSGDGHPLVWIADLPGYENQRLALPRYYDAGCFLSDNDQYDSTAYYAGPGFMEPDNHIHIRLSKTADMRAAEERYGTVLDAENARPGDYSIIVGDAGHTLGIYGSYLEFRDLVLEPAFRTIGLYNGAHDLVFENLTIWVGWRGIGVRSYDVHHVTVRNCRVYGDCAPWFFRSDQKSSIPPGPLGSFESVGIDLGSGSHDWEIAYNHIRGAAQNLIELAPQTPDAPPEYNLSIHHNRMENAAEDAIRLGPAVELGRVEIYENCIANCLHVLTAGEDTPTFTGPLLFYRNVVAFLRDPPVNRAPGLLSWNKGLRYGFEYLFKISGSSFTTQNTHLYQNTLVLLNSAGKGMNFIPQFPADTRCANNLLVLVNGRVNGSYPRGAGQVVDGNLYWKMNTVDTERLMDSYDTVAACYAAAGLEEHGLGATPKRGTDPMLPGLALQIVDPTQTRWSIDADSERRQPWSFALDATSPARGAGIAIPPHPVLGVLPDTRTSLDIGALPYGTQAADFGYFPFDPAPNQAPVVDAGPDQSVLAPDVDLAGQVSDDGHPLTGARVTRWSVRSGPGPVAFEDSRRAGTRATFTERGGATSSSSPPPTASGRSRTA